MEGATVSSALLSIADGQISLFTTDLLSCLFSKIQHGTV